MFVQAGVGGVAAAVAGYLAETLGADRPHFTCVDPVRAASVYESARAGRVVQVPEGAPTVMAMLDCYEPSMIAFRVLERAADGFMVVEEETSPEVMQRLANPVAGDPPVVAGESGGAGLAGVLTVLRDPALAARIGLGPEARVLVFNTEGATDAALYAEHVGRTPAQVLAGAGAGAS